MGVLTKQDINNYYITYKDNEVLFNKKVSEILKIQPKHIYIKFKDVQRPCIIYSSSMSKAKVIINIDENLINKIKSENNINLRFAIDHDEKKNDILFFFVKCRAIDITPYKLEKRLYLIELQFTNKPPETLISILGKVLDANKNSIERSEERIIVEKSNLNKLGLKSSAINLLIDNIPRQAILRDISFGGIKVLLAGNSKFLNNKPVKVVISHKDYGLISLLGKSIRAESLTNRKDIVAMAIKLDNNLLPVEYKFMINEYMKSNRIIDKLNSVDNTNISK